jgi:hypothetical protein
VGHLQRQPVELLLHYMYATTSHCNSTVRRRRRTSSRQSSPLPVRFLLRALVDRPFGSSSSTHRRYSIRHWSGFSSMSTRAASPVFTTPTTFPPCHAMVTTDGGGSGGGERLWTEGGSDPSPLFPDIGVGIAGDATVAVHPAFFCLRERFRCLLETA